MKRRGESRECRGEGWLVAAALVFVLALSFAVCWMRIPTKEALAPIHAADFALLRQAEMVNLNTASVERLASLPGIGQVLAQRIVDARELNAPFESVEELLQVEGIGEGKLKAIRSEIYVD